MVNFSVITRPDFPLGLEIIVLPSPVTELTIIMSSNLLFNHLVGLS